MVDVLKHKINHRPNKLQLAVQQCTLNCRDDANAPGKSQHHHSHQQQQQQLMLLKKCRLVDALNEKIAHRPGPLELVQDNILHVDTALAEAVKDGRLQFKPTSAGLIVRHPQNTTTTASLFGPQQPCTNRCCEISPSVVSSSAEAIKPSSTVMTSGASSSSSVLVCRRDRTFVQSVATSADVSISLNGGGTACDQSISGTSVALAQKGAKQQQKRKRHRKDGSTVIEAPSKQLSHHVCTCKTKVMKLQERNEESVVPYPNDDAFRLSTANCDYHRKGDAGCRESLSSNCFEDHFLHSSDFMSEALLNLKSLNGCTARASDGVESDDSNVRCSGSSPSSFGTTVCTMSPSDDCAADGSDVNLTETSYDLLLRQQQLLLQWQMELHRKYVNPGNFCTNGAGGTGDAHNAALSAAELNATTPNDRLRSTEVVNNNDRGHGPRRFNCCNVLDLQMTDCTGKTTSFFNSQQQQRTPDVTERSLSYSPGDSRGSFSSDVSASSDAISGRPQATAPSSKSKSSSGSASSSSTKASPSSSHASPGSNGSRRLQDMKVSELKAECKKRSLPVSGSKVHLLERLKSFEHVICGGNGDSCQNSSSDSCSSAAGQSSKKLLSLPPISFLSGGVTTSGSGPSVSYNGYVNSTMSNEAMTPRSCSSQGNPPPGHVKFKNDYPANSYSGGCHSHRTEDSSGGQQWGHYKEVREGTAPKCPTDTSSADQTLPAEADGPTDAGSGRNASEPVISADCKLSDLLLHEDMLREQQHKIDEIQKELQKSQSMLRKQQQIIISSRQALESQNAASGADSSQATAETKQLQRTHIQLFLQQKFQQQRFQQQLATHHHLIENQKQILEKMTTDRAVAEITNLMKEDSKLALLMLYLLRRYSLEADAVDGQGGSSSSQLECGLRCKYASGTNTEQQSPKRPSISRPSSLPSSPQKQKSSSSSSSSSSTVAVDMDEIFRNVLSYAASQVTVKVSPPPTTAGSVISVSSSSPQMETMPIEPQPPQPPPAPSDVYLGNKPQTLPSCENLIPNRPAVMDDIEFAIHSSAKCETERLPVDCSVCTSNQNYVYTRNEAFEDLMEVFQDNDFFSGSSSVQQKSDPSKTGQQKSSMDCSAKATAVLPNGFVNSDLSAPNVREQIYSSDSIYSCASIDLMSKKSDLMQTDCPFFCDVLSTDKVKVSDAELPQAIVKREFCLNDSPHCNDKSGIQFDWLDMMSCSNGLTFQNVNGAVTLRSSSSGTDPFMNMVDFVSPCQTTFSQNMRQNSADVV